MKNKILCTFLIIATGLFAQVKIGNSPANLATNAFFQVEGTTSANQLVFLKSGNIGIGLTSPSAQFETTGTMKFTGAGTPGAGKVLSSDAVGNASWITLPSSATASNGLSATLGEVKLGGTLTQGSSIVNAGFNLGITGAGNLGVGTATPASKLQVILGTTNGNLADWTANTATFGEADSRGSALGLGYDSTNNEAWISSLTPSVSWRTLKFNAKSWKFLADGTRETLTLNNNGTLAINTTAPNSQPKYVTNAFEITDESGGALSDITQRVVGSGFPSYNMIKSRGTAAAPSIPTAQSEVLGSINFASTTGGSANFVNAAKIFSAVDGTPTASAFGGALILAMKDTNASFATPSVYFSSTGKIGIGMGSFIPDFGLDVFSNAGTTARFKSTSNDPNGVVLIDVPSTSSVCSTCSELMIFTQGGPTVIGYVGYNLAGNSVAFNTTSDKRLKEDIKVPTIGIKELMQIQIADYHRIGSPKDQREIGYIAQQLNTIFPDAVAKGSENVSEKPWMVDYGRISPLLVKAIQDQEIQLNLLETEIDSLLKN